MRRRGRIEVLTVKLLPRLKQLSQTPRMAPARENDLELEVYDILHEICRIPKDEQLGDEIHGFLLGSGHYPKHSTYKQRGYSRSPLELAISLGHYKVVKILLQDITLEEADAALCLKEAIERGCLRTISAIAEAIIDSKIDLLSLRLESGGRSCLSYAAWYNPRLELGQRLLKIAHEEQPKEACLAVKGGQLEKALDIAVEQTDLQTVEALIECGVDTSNVEDGVMHGAIVKANAVANAIRRARERESKKRESKGKRGGMRRGLLRKKPEREEMKRLRVEDANVA